LTNAKAPLILITSTVWPYLRDIVDVMFLQQGLEYRFRYTNHYIHPDILKREELTGRNGFIVHIDAAERPHEEYETEHENADKYDEIREFLPIREVTIREVQSLGDFIWVRFEVGAWVKFSEDRETQVNELHEAVEKSTPKESRSVLRFTMYEAPGLYLPTTSNSSEWSHEVISNWIRIVKRMKEFQAHKARTPTYMKLTSVKSLASNQFLTPKLLEGGGRGYEFKSDKDHQLEIFQYTPHYRPDALIPKPFNLNLVIDEKRIIPLVGHANVIGKYDSLRLSFRPSPTIRDYGTVISFEQETGIDTDRLVNGKSGATSNVETSQRMDLSVELYAKVLRGWRQLVAAFGIAAGIVLASTVSIGPALWLAITIPLAVLFGVLGVYYGGVKD